VAGVTGRFSPGRNGTVEDQKPQEQKAAQGEAKAQDAKSPPARPAPCPSDPRIEPLERR